VYGKPQNRLQEVSADEIGRLIQAIALYCGISQEAIPQQGQIRRIVEVLEEIKFLIFGPRLTALIENSLAKYGIFSGISTLKNRPDEKH